jgi:hypothetical protein
LSRKCTIVGTSVRDSTYDISIANTTASAIGTNSERAAPVRNAIGANTMQMHRVETNAGTAICCAPSMIARVNGLRWCMLRWMFSIATVASSTRMPTASARPPSVITLSVSPSAHSTMVENRIDSGIEITTVSVERQLPRNIKIISAVSPAAISASRTTPLIDARTKID